MSSKQPKKQPDYLARSIQMAVVMAAFVFGGYSADKAIGIKFPVFTILLSLCGVALAIYILVRDSK